MMRAISGITGSLIMFLYNLVGNNYGVAIILFTIIFKLLLMPLTLKSARASKKQLEIQPRVLEIQEKYKDNPEQQMKALKELYSENDISMFGGCLPLLIQFPVIIAVFWTLSQPLTYCLKLPQSEINTLIQNVSSSETRYAEMFVANQNNLINFNFLGMNIGSNPKLILNFENMILWIFPILSGLTTYISLKLTQPKKKDEKEKVKNSEMDSTESMMSTMSIITPLMSAYISCIAPVGLSIYWICGNLIQIIQQNIILPKYMKIKEKSTVKYEVIEDKKEIEANNKKETKSEKSNENKKENKDKSKNKSNKKKNPKRR